MNNIRVIRNPLMKAPRAKAPAPHYSSWIAPLAMVAAGVAAGLLRRGKKAPEPIPAEPGALLAVRCTVVIARYERC